MMSNSTNNDDGGILAGGSPNSISSIPEAISSPISSNEGVVCSSSNPEDVSSATSSNEGIVESSSTLVTLSTADLSFNSPGSKFEICESSRKSISSADAVEDGPTSTIVVSESSRALSSLEGESSSHVTAVVSTSEFGAVSRGVVLSDLAIADGSSLFTIQPPDMHLLSQVFRGLQISSIEDFHANPTRFSRLEHVLGAALSFSKDRAGSLFVVNCLEGAGDAEKGLFLMEIMPHVSYLATHPYGNLVIQKIILVCDCVSHIFTLAFVLSQSIPFLSCNQFGCQVVLRLLYKASQVFADQPTLSIIVTEILPHVCSLASHYLGNFVVQVVIRIGDDTVRDRIIGILMDHITLMVHVSGEFAYHVYRRLMVSCNGSQLSHLVLQLNGFLYEHEAALMQSQFGLEIVCCVRHLIGLGSERLILM